MKTLAETITNQTPDAWHSHILCLGKEASTLFADCNTSASVHIHLVRERHYLVAPDKGSKPVRFHDNALLLAVIDRDEPAPGEWLTRFGLTLQALPLVLITLGCAASSQEARKIQTDDQGALSSQRSRWLFADTCCSPEALARFIVLTAEPLELGKNTLICVDFADYLCAFDGEGLIHVAHSAGHGCEQAQAAADVAIEQLRATGASLENALGVALIVEIAAECAAGIALIDEIASYIKSRARDDIVVVVSAPLNRTLRGETFNIFLAVRQPYGSRSNRRQRS